MRIRDTRTRAEDSSGDQLADLLGQAGHLLATRDLIPDDRYRLRAVLSLCGLGMLDETEVATIRGAEPVPMPNDEVGKPIPLPGKPVTTKPPPTTKPEPTEDPEPEPEPEQPEGDPVLSEDDFIVRRKAAIRKLVEVHEFLGTSGMERVFAKFPAAPRSSNAVTPRNLAAFERAVAACAAELESVEAGS